MAKKIFVQGPVGPAYDVTERFQPHEVRALLLQAQLKEKDKDYEQLSEDVRYMRQQLQAQADELQKARQALVGVKQYLRRLQTGEYRHLLKRGWVVEDLQRALGLLSGEKNFLTSSSPKPRPPVRTPPRSRNSHMNDVEERRCQ